MEKPWTTKEGQRANEQGEKIQIALTMKIKDFNTVKENCKLCQFVKLHWKAVNVKGINKKSLKKVSQLLSCLSFSELDLTHPALGIHLIQGLRWLVCSLEVCILHNQKMLAYLIVTHPWTTSYKKILGILNQRFCQLNGEFPCNFLSVFSGTGKESFFCCSTLQRQPPFLSFPVRSKCYFSYCSCILH